MQSTKCQRSVLEAVKNSSVTFVITWSGGSRGSTAGYDGQLFSGLRQLRALVDSPRIRVLIDAKGSDCDLLPKPLLGWARSGRVHCIEGPNMAAREAHTILRFCATFYDHLPLRGVVFLQVLLLLLWAESGSAPDPWRGLDSAACPPTAQDDPNIKHLRGVGVGSKGFFNKLEHEYAARKQGGAARPPGGRGARRGRGRGERGRGLERGSEEPGSAPFEPPTEAPWELRPCPCTTEHERHINARQVGARGREEHVQRG